jgi:hypothetical protein
MIPADKAFFWLTALALGASSSMTAGCGSVVRVIGDGGAADGTSGVETETETESGADDGAQAMCNSNIVASNYDDTCAVDNDCIALTSGGVVFFGNWCGTECPCVNGAINRDSEAQYVADVARTPIGTGAVRPPSCGCPNAGVPCCQAGRLSLSCGGSSANPDAGDEADGGSTLPYGSVLCGASGPDASGGSAIWCVPPQACTPYNGGWACCVPVGVPSSSRPSARRRSRARSAQPWTRASRCRARSPLRSAR